MASHSFRAYRPPRLSPDEMLERAREYYDLMESRRSVRDFSPDSVPRQLIELAIATASTAPSGAHRQPWSFVAVSEPEIKREIRLAAEAEERAAEAERKAVRSMRRPGEESEATRQ